MGKERIIWIDYLKFVAIFFVVWGHNNGNNILLKSLIYSFHMPLFFMISGYLHSAKLPFNLTLKKNVKTLLLPYFYLTLLISPIYLYEIHKGNDSYLELIIRFISGDLAWFIMALFLMKLISHPFLKQKNNFLIFGIILFSFFIVLTINNIFGADNSLIAKVSRIFRFLPFFLFGYILKQKNMQQLGKKPISFISSLIITTAIYYLYGSAEMNRLYSFFDIVVFVIEGIAISFIVFFVSRIYRRNNKFIQTISNGTIIIYLLHFPLLRITGRIPLTESTLFNLGITFCCSLFIVVLFYIPIIYALNRCPWILGKVSKTIVRKEIINK